MKKQTKNQATIDNNQKIEMPHYSDGSELIPAGIKSDLESNDNIVAGYTKDDEGIIDNFSVEPTIYPATYPTSKQQLRYIFIGVGAFILVATVLLIGFRVS